jgi:hypothetical protein
VAEHYSRVGRLWLDVDKSELEAPTHCGGRHEDVGEVAGSGEEGREVGGDGASRWESSLSVSEATSTGTSAPPPPWLAPASLRPVAAPSPAAARREGNGVLPGRPTRGRAASRRASWRRMVDPRVSAQRSNQW